MLEIIQKLKQLWEGIYIRNEACYTMNKLSLLGGFQL